jgi:hypothetical protein
MGGIGPIRTEDRSPREHAEGREGNHASERGEHDLPPGHAPSLLPVAAGSLVTVAAGSLDGEAAVSLPAESGAGGAVLSVDFSRDSGLSVRGASPDRAASLAARSFADPGADAMR